MTHEHHVKVINPLPWKAEIPIGAPSALITEVALDWIAVVMVDATKRRSVDRTWVCSLVPIQRLPESNKSRKFEIFVDMAHQRGGWDEEIGRRTEFPNPTNATLPKTLNIAAPPSRIPAPADVIAKI